MAVYNGLSLAMDAIPAMRLADVPQAQKVATSLLIRISDDLRSASLLALRGYPTQAASLVSSIYEAALTVIYVGKNEDIAQEWIDHEDPTSLFMPIKKLTQKALVSLGLDNLESRTPELYKTYSQLCMAKHANPLYQMQRGLQRSDGGVQAVNGPDISNDGVRSAWFALEHGARLCLMAGASFIENFVPKDQRDRLQKHLADIGVGCNDLSSKAAERFGSSDPFPGKWKT